MPKHIRIAIYEPGFQQNEERYFAINIKRLLRNERTTYSSTDNIAVIPDFDGSFFKLRNTLQKLEIVNKYHQWMFKDGHLVIIGNSLHNREEITEYLWYIYSLEQKAIRQNGHIHFILAPNEPSYINGEWKNEHPKYVHKKRSSGEPYAILYDGNRELARWLRTKNSMEQIGNILFISGEMPDQDNRSYAYDTNAIVQIDKSSEQIIYRWKEKTFTLPIIDKEDTETLLIRHERPYRMMPHGMKARL